MTWHELFDLRTIEHRHIVYAFGIVILLQGGYLAAVTRSWLRLNRSDRKLARLNEV